MMKVFSPRLIMIDVLTILLVTLLISGTIYAEDYKDYSPGQIKKLMENEIIPLSKRLSPLLREVLPKKDGKYFPITLRYAPDWPNDPEKPQRVHFHCPWGATICEPFLRACISLQQSCSCSDYGSIDPDPC